MAATDRLGSVFARVWTTRTANSATAFAIGIPAALATVELTGSVLTAFFVLYVLGVTVPYSYTTRWPGSLRDEPPSAVAWTVVASVVAAAAFVGITVALRGLTDASTALSSVPAFVVVGLGGPEFVSAVADRRGALG